MDVNFTTRARFVAVAVALQQSHGTFFAACYLAENDIDIELAVIVLVGESSVCLHGQSVGANTSCLVFNRIEIVLAPRLPAGRMVSAQSCKKLK